MNNIFVEHYRSKKNTAAWFAKNLAVVAMIVLFFLLPAIFEYGWFIGWVILSVISIFWVDYCKRNFYNK